MAKFSIEDNFFIIDSNNLDDIRTKLYGFCISEYSNFTDSLDNKINLNGLGAYIYVFVDENRITINQDYIGSYGLYLFQDKDYFALSNSFIYLVDYIKTTHKITLNKDYANYLLIRDLCSEIYEDTIVNEIKMLDRSAFIEIDKTNKILKIDYVDYKENTVELGSDECFDILDNWYNRWTNIIRNLKLETNNISTDLSGGMDSRLIFLLFLGSEIDLKTININSIDGKLHTFVEDFEIATEITNYYQFALNKKIALEKTSFSLKDTLNISFYTKLCFHKQMFFKKIRNIKTFYKFAGLGGECIRDYWNFANIDEFIKNIQDSVKIYPNELHSELLVSVEKILNKSLSKIKEKLNVDKIDDIDLLHNLYRETRCRNHFGKGLVEDSFSNTVTLTPLLDPELHKIKLSSNECVDKNLLISLIFVRYCPNLLNYKFEGKRFIKKDTIEYANKINAKNPFKKNSNIIQKEYKIINSFDLYSQLKKDEMIISKKDELSPSDFLLNIFNSARLKYLFTVYYNQSIIDSINIDMQKRKYHPLTHVYGVIGITKVIGDILISEEIDKFDNVFDEISNFTNNKEIIYDLNSEIQKLHNQNNDLRNQNNVKDQVIKQLQNSWSYRIGRVITYSLSIPFEFVKFIRDYNLIKKSNLFDSEYYLANNEDVEKAKVDPIKHYLKFGWKEGRNPSAEFDGNEYLNKRPDVRVAGICPLVHYIKFGKDEK